MLAKQQNKWKEKKCGFNKSCEKIEEKAKQKKICLFQFSNLPENVFVSLCLRLRIAVFDAYLSIYHRQRCNREKCIIFLLPLCKWQNKINMNNRHAFNAIILSRNKKNVIYTKKIKWTISHCQMPNVFVIYSRKYRMWWLTAWQWIFFPEGAEGG
jgi:hypothetical protein